MEKDRNASSSADGGKDHYKAAQENSHSEKSSSGSNGNDRSFKSNRQKIDSNIEPDAIDTENNKSADKTSKEAAE